MIDIEKVNHYLEKYWNCETSVEEEEELRDFFLQDEIPESLRQYRPLFSYIASEQLVTPSKEFNDRWGSVPSETEDDGRYVTIRIFKPLLRIAVSVVLLIGVGISFYFISKEDNRPHFVETFEDPNAAMEQATFALEKLSSALQKSEAASVEAIQFIDELDIDWTAIDSLNRVLPWESDSIETE